MYKKVFAIVWHYLEKLLFAKILSTNLFLLADTGKYVHFLSNIELAKDFWRRYYQRKRFEDHSNTTGKGIVVDEE